MKICSLNSNNGKFFGGWNYISSELKKIETDIWMVDYVDKYFNLFFDVDKNIHLANNSIKKKVGDTLYSIFDDDKQDIFCINENDTENKVKKYARWYPEYNEFKLVRGLLELHVNKKFQYAPIKNNKWIGIIHYPKFINEKDSFESFNNFVKSKHFLESIDNCLGFITLSEHLKCELQQSAVFPINIPIHALCHPFTSGEHEWFPTFEMQNFMLNEKKKLLQIGWWMRDLSMIVSIDTPANMQKIILPGGCDSTFLQTVPSSIQILDFASKDEYNKLLACNIVVMHVYNSSANNTVLECIERNTPIIINKHPAVCEYLGHKYPLFISTAKEISEFLKSKNFLDTICTAHLYLKHMDKSRFQLSTFIKDIKLILHNL